MFKDIIFGLKSLLNKPFKVGLITYYYPQKGKSYNGVAIHVSYLAKELARLGCDVHIFARGDKHSVRKEHHGPGRIVIHNLKLTDHGTIKNPVMNKRFVYSLFDNAIISSITNENNKEKFDVIHSHGWLTSGAFISKHLNDIKWVHTFHALEKNRLKFMSKEEKEYFNVAQWVESNISHADSLITVSEHLKGEVLSEYPVKKNRVTYISNGVDLEVFHPEGNNQDNKVLYVGRFSMEKGIDLVPKIIKKVLEGNDKAKFQIVAPAGQSKVPSARKTEKEFEKLQEEFPERFFWIKEPIGRTELAKLYNECSIFIQPSRYEAFGLTTLEAMACGKAVITSNKGALPEVVGNSGKFIPLNSGLFAKEILNLLEDYRLRERYGRRGIEKSKEFTWESVAKKVLENYEKITNKKAIQIKQDK